MLNRYGTKGTIDVSYSKSNPGFKLEKQDIESEGYYFTLGLSHPLIRTRQHNLTLASDFSWKDVTSTALKLPLYEDRVRSASPVAFLRRQ